MYVRRCGLGRCAGLGEKTGVDAQGLRARMLRGAVPESRAKWQPRRRSEPVAGAGIFAQKGAARRPRKRFRRFVRGFCNAGAAAACALRQRPAACAVRAAREAAARAFSLPPLLLREFFFEESVGRVVHERLRALEPALGGVYGLAGARGPPQAKHARGGGGRQPTQRQAGAPSSSRLQEELPWVACTMGAFPRSHRIAVAPFRTRNASG